MKKIFLFATIVALSFAVIPANAQSRKDKKAAEKANWEMKQQQQREEEELKHKMKMDSIANAQKRAEEKAQMEYEADKRQRESEAAIAAMKLQNAQKATAIQLEQKILIPCIGDSYDKPGEYMAGLGIVENQTDRTRGTMQANRAAIEDIATRFIGTVSNAVSQYAKDVNTRQREKVKEDELEGEATVIGKKAIEQHANIVCRDYRTADDGTYTCYVAIHVPLGKIINDLQNQMQVLQVDADRARFRQFVEQELGKQAAEKEAEQKQINALRQSSYGL